MILAFLRKLFQIEKHDVSRRSFLRALVSVPALAIPASLAIAPIPVTTGGTGASTLKNLIEKPISPGVSSRGTGYKGSDKYDAGYFYCPYIPLMS